MLCARTRSNVGVNGSHHDVGTRAVVKSLDMHAPHPRMLLSICRVGDCCDCLESVHAAACTTFVRILSSLLMLDPTCDLLGSFCCLKRIAHRSSCVHRRLLGVKVQSEPHTSCCLVTRIPSFIPSPQSMHGGGESLLLVLLS